MQRRRLNFAVENTCLGTPHVGENQFIRSGITFTGENMHDRNDLAMTLLIEHTLAAGESHSLIDTAWELVEKGVPADVALRVVARPADRRHYNNVTSMALRT
jgi:hypothetical protein